ncbi:response regulator transcription factor [Paenibacillus sp. SC116]|uniref:response regulator transcription factor n=1 Tax=Paenibacillus sp. SC116 TaxID=2968986 RepID=UPI00215AA258|nr:response regulator transcription factor [Paenibacillus sp. SC116]MCR8845611.1 response regulator transcription factor [Paenibacillus sp. SC116]
MNILVADDEWQMVKLIQVYFEQAGFQVHTAKNGEEALEIIEHHSIDLAVLDWMMPIMSGIQACKEMKRRGQIKVLMLTAKGDHEAELQALEAGADDYVKKPFDPRVLLIRAKKLLQIDGQARIGDLVIDREGHKVWKAGKDLHVTKKEFQLLKCFMNNRGRVLTREVLLDQVWGIDYVGEDRTVDTHIRRLREKIGEEWIVTHRGLGYSFEHNHE